MIYHMFLVCSFANPKKALILLSVFSIDKCCVFLIYYTHMIKNYTMKKMQVKSIRLLRKIQSAKKELYSDRVMRQSLFDVMYNNQTVRG